MDKKEIPAVHRAVLEKYGFENSYGELSFAFYAPSLSLDTHMLVQGDHATDHSHIFYAHTQAYEGELDGFFYSPSLLEYLLTDYSGEWDPECMLKEINVQMDGNFRLVSVGGYPMLFTELTEYDWKDDNLRYALSDMLKLVGQLDYLLPRKWRTLMAKRRKKHS